MNRIHYVVLSLLVVGAGVVAYIFVGKNARINELYADLLEARKSLKLLLLAKKTEALRDKYEASLNTFLKKAIADGAEVSYPVIPGPATASQPEASTESGAEPVLPENPQSCTEQCVESLLLCRSLEEAQQEQINALVEENSQLQQNNVDLKRKLDRAPRALPWIITTTLLGVALGAAITINF